MDQRCLLHGCLHRTCTLRRRFDALDPYWRRPSSSCAKQVAVSHKDAASHTPPVTPNDRTSPGTVMEERDSVCGSCARTHRRSDVSRLCHTHTNDGILDPLVTT